jgi:dynein heavy chain
LIIRRTYFTNCSLLDDALNFVAQRFLSDIDFKPGELYGCVELCEHFHLSTIELSKEVRWKYKLYNYVTPASYLELNTLFKKLLIEQREKAKKTKSMYQVSLEKLKGAESQVTVMQAEMSALQPKLTVASKEVDSSMTFVEKEQTEVAELEKIVKGRDTR